MDTQNQESGRRETGGELQLAAPASAQDPASSRKQLSYKSAVSVSQVDSRTAMDEYRKRQKEKAEQENSNLWQHPFVDVFKHFKIQPGMDWKQNKKQGDVNEYFAKEIGRRAISIEGTISANNFIQAPHPTGPVKSLGLTGRYIYFQVKCPRHGLPFSYHVDLGLAERSHGVRLSISNLFKNFNTSNGFVAQIPLELKNNCWTIVVIDVIETLKRSKILPSTYLLEGSYQVRSVNVCANTHIRGVFTSDNLYDFVTLPADMRYKFAFDLSKWPEYFDWQQLPSDWDRKTKKDENGEVVPGDENLNLQNLVEANRTSNKQGTREELRTHMRAEIDGLLYDQNKQEEEQEHLETGSDVRKRRYDDMQKQLNMQFSAGPADHPVNGYIVKDEDYDQSGTKAGASRSRSGAVGGTGRSAEYRSGQFSGHELSRSHKLNKDPIMELKHIIGYQADKCYDIRWSKQEGENVVLFTSGGTLIAMDSETNEQKRFFFGHSAPICCFDLNSQGNLIASAQEGKNSIIRLWDYATARCITMVTMPVVSMKCLSFSFDGRYLASVGKDTHQKELIIVWDISRVQRGEKPEVVAKQTSEFNIIQLKFSPIDPTRLASCGKENIRLWRIRDTANIRGSAIVLNHHARDTVFTTLDFEYGFRATDRLENESLKRIFVGSKHGIVYQVNYQTEQLEATYKTNDKAIYSIAVNDAFCVIGSEDSYLRVWPLDFQEFFMEAQHEGPVSAVDISNDGLKVVCGTLYGSIGILDKSNQNYKTLLRSHTDEILALDFHKIKMNIITVSRDKTIRLWDVKTLEEVYEFSSPFDQPLCISAHPSQSIFACGFHSGKMRIFDIDTTEVIDEFSQFKKPLKSLSYDNSGKYLVTCCEDGSVSIHNAARQHLPIKMMHLEMPPEFVHVAFSTRMPGDDDSRQRFGVMGEYGNNVIVYDTESFLIHHQVMVNNIVKSFKFANNNNDLLVVTKDCKIRFYGLVRYEGVFLREIANCHRGSINSIDVSCNSGYMLTAGEDSMVKIWDYDAQKTIPFFFQSFIGHTYPLTAIIFNPRNNNQVISVGERDGIYIWDFNGDMEGDYRSDQLAGQDLQTMRDVETKKTSLLEQIRTTNKARKEFRNQMREDSFIVPQSVQFERVASSQHPDGPDRFHPPPNRVAIERADRKLTYNHYCNLNKKVDIEVESNAMMSNLSLGDTRHQLLEQKLINGYDGFGGVHDNLYWNIKDGLTYFTLNNKLIIEKTKTREQTVFADSSVQLSCLAVSRDGKLVAAGEGSPNCTGTSLVFVYDVEKNKQIMRFTCTVHPKGIQSMAFFENKYLITLGVQGEPNSLALWNLQRRLMEESALMDYTVNQVRVDPHTAGSSTFQFITVGNNATLTVWRYDTEAAKAGHSGEAVQALHPILVQPPRQLLDLHFLSVAFTDYLPAPVGTYYAVVGVSDGSLVPVVIPLNHPEFSSPEEEEEKPRFVGDAHMRSRISGGEVGAISIAHDAIVIGCSDGVVAYYPIVGSQISPQDPDMVVTHRLESAVVAISMDELNKQGLIGTEAGCIHYVNFQEMVPPIKLVSSNNMNQDAIHHLKFDFANPRVFLAACGQRTEQLKLYTGENCDQVMNFEANFEEEGYVVFVIGHPQFSKLKSGSGRGPLSKKQVRLVGFSNGYIKVLSITTLAVKHSFRVPLNREAGEVLTCGQYSQNNKNFAFGTNHGTLFVGNLVQAKRMDANYAKIVNVGKCNNFETADQTQKRHTKQLNSDIINDNESLDIEHMDSVLDFNEMTGITSIHFPYHEPIGTLLVAFDDGVIRLWQCQQNPNVIKVIQLQNNNSGPALYDLFDMGYQQFDVQDHFDIFQNPDDLEEVSEDERMRLRSLYKSKSHPTCQARFFPMAGAAPPIDLYLCLVEALQFVFIRNWQRSETIRRIGLGSHPSCFDLMSYSRIVRRMPEDSPARDAARSKAAYLMALGTKDGKTMIYKISTAQTTKPPYAYSKLYSSKAGVAYGGITAVDIQSSPGADLFNVDGDFMIAATETGEIHQYELVKRLADDA